MMSQRKTLLRRTEYLVAIYVPIAVLAAWGVATGRLLPTQVESKLLLVIGMMIWTAAIWVGLFREFVVLKFGPKSPNLESNSLSLADAFAMQRWCPLWIKATYGLAAILFVLALGGGGHIRWSSAAPFTRGDAIGFLLLSSTFALLALPTIASASRMPGTFAQNLGPGNASPNASPVAGPPR